MEYRKPNQRRNYYGQSMVEAMVAVGIALLLVMGLVAATTNTLRFGQMTKVRTLALQYAKEGLEIVRIIKDTSWNDIPQTDSTYCLGKGDLTLGDSDSPPCPMDIDNFFSRTVVFSDDLENPENCRAVDHCRKVSVTVSWIEKGETRSVVLTSYITNWRTR